MKWHLMILIMTAASATLAQPQPPAQLNVPIQALTQGPASHWFAYYDKCQFDPAGRYVLGMAVTFNDRPPRPEDAIELGYIDRQQNNAWTPFAQTTAWCWQQGCMLQWLPGSSSKVIYNTRTETGYGAIIQDLFTGEKQTLPHPIYAISPDAKHAIFPNFHRLGQTRPGYGYNGFPDPFSSELHPAGDGIYTMDLQTGQAHLIITLDQIANLNMEAKPVGKHWFNHLLYNQDGSRFIFLHRWNPNPNVTIWQTRMFTAAADGSALHIINDHQMTSHFIWKNPTQILAWSREPEKQDRFHLYTDQTETVETVGEGILKQDGHISYSPDGQWLVTDTYPDKERMQTLMLFNPASARLEILGKFYMPPIDLIETRCDLHPRWSPDGRFLCIDSRHDQGQRQIYLLDVSSITHPQ